jgi:hypothetical protein
MENIKSLPPMERPRERMQIYGASSLRDEELLAILLGSGTPQVPLNLLCENLLQKKKLADLAQIDMDGLCEFKGIGPVKATILLAAVELSRRLRPSSLLLANENACAIYLRPLLLEEAQLQYILLLMSGARELLAFSEAGCVLPNIGWITGLAVEAGAGRVLLGRNGWPAFSNAEGRYLGELRAACAALNLVCDGLMAVGPERFKMI